MAHSARFDLDFSSDFPVDEVEAMHAYLSDRHPGDPDTEAWKEWSVGLNGTMYRFLATDEAFVSAAASLRSRTDPPQPERYRQENSLFTFYFAGLSTIECLCYALYFVGTRANPAAFPITVSRRDVVPSFVAQAFATAFAATTVAGALDAMIRSDDWTTWNAVRNALGHRGAFGRTFYRGGGPVSGVDWNLPVSSVNVAVELEPATLLSRRQWLAARVSELVASGHALAQSEIP
jgi:hypothetical protein